MTNNSIREILRRTKVVVAPETYYLLGMPHEAWLKLIETPELSPRMTVPFMIFKDRHETTLLLDDVDYGTIRHGVRDARTEGGFRLLTFDVELDFTVVGFLAAVTGVLAEAGIPIVALSAFTRDHLLIKQGDLAKTLKILGEYVEELC